MQRFRLAILHRFLDRDAFEQVTHGSVRRGERVVEVVGVLDCLECSTRDRIGEEPSIEPFLH